jgi:hypothetical protein
MRQSMRKLTGFASAVIFINLVMAGQAALAEPPAGKTASARRGQLMWAASIGIDQAVKSLAISGKSAESSLASAAKESSVEASGSARMEKRSPLAIEELNPPPSGSRPAVITQRAMDDGNGRRLEIGFWYIDAINHNIFTKEWWGNLKQENSAGRISIIKEGAGSGEKVFIHYSGDREFEIEMSRANFQQFTDRLSETLARRVSGNSSFESGYAVLSYGRYVYRINLYQYTGKRMFGHKVIDIELSDMAAKEFWRLCSAAL